MSAVSVSQRGPIFAKIDVGEKHRQAPASKARDCTVRALSVAAAISYPAAWELLYKHQGVCKSNCFDLNALLDQRLTDSVFIRLANQNNHGSWSHEWTVRAALAFPAMKGKPRMTPGAFARAHPKGRYVLSLAHHNVAVREGIVIDIWDCTKRCVYKAWEIELPGNRSEES